MGNCCCGDIPDQSCGWPKGTVRALISLIIVVLTFMAAIAASIMFLQRGEYAYSMGILGTLFSIISAVIAYYFGTKNGEATGKAMVESNERLIAEKDKEIEMIKENHEESMRELGNQRNRNRNRNRSRSSKKRNKRNIVLPTDTIIEIDELNDVETTIL